MIHQVGKNTIVTKTTYNRWDENCRSVYVWAEWDGHSRQIASIVQYISLDDSKPEPVMVNWGAAGFVSSEDAIAAGLAIQDAAIIARDIEDIEEWGRITPPIEGACWKGDGAPEITIKDGKASVSTEGWEVKG